MFILQCLCSQIKAFWIAIPRFSLGIPVELLLRDTKYDMGKEAQRELRDIQRIATQGKSNHSDAVPITAHPLQIPISVELWLLYSQPSTFLYFAPLWEGYVALTFLTSDGYHLLYIHVAESETPYPHTVFWSQLYGKLLFWQTFYNDIRQLCWSVCSFVHLCALQNYNDCGEKNITMETWL